MRVILQRVSEASVLIDLVVHGKIGRGLLLLVGITEGDGEEDVDWLVRKIVQMRIFSDAEGKMNRSLSEVNGDLLLISQFTLHASTKKGNRPSYTRAAPPAVAVPLYDRIIQCFEEVLGHSIKTGQFGADMEVHLVNDGPVTIMVDSKNRE
jgi:D-aminoacyl-tRNA deacylase